MSPAEPEPHSTPPSRSFRWRERERPEAADDLASWCTEAARLLTLARRLGAGHPDTRALTRRLVPELVQHVQRHGPIELDVTPRSIVLGDETVFAADHSNAPTGERGLERELSWALHRDGLRVLKLERGFTEAEAATLLDVLLHAAPADATDEDLVTMLWESGFTHLTTVTEEADVVRLNPLTGRPGSAGGPVSVGSVPHVDDWPLVEAPTVDVKRLWQEHRRSELLPCIERLAYIVERIRCVVILPRCAGQFGKHRSGVFTEFVSLIEAPSRIVQLALPDETRAKAIVELGFLWVDSH